MGSVRERDMWTPTRITNRNGGLVDYDPKLTEHDAARSQWLGGLRGGLIQDEVGESSVSVALFG